MIIKPKIMTDGAGLTVTNQIVYIKVILSADCSADAEVDNKISKTSAASLE